MVFVQLSWHLADLSQPAALERGTKGKEMIIFSFLVCEAAFAPTAYLQWSIPLIGHGIVPSELYSQHGHTV